MADTAFRLFGSTRPRPDPKRPTPLQQFVERVDQETKGPTVELVRIYKEALVYRSRRRP